MTLREYLKQKKREEESDYGVTQSYFESANNLLERATPADDTPTYQWVNDNAQYFSENIAELEKNNERVGNYIESLKGTDDYEAASKQFNDYRNALSKTKDYLNGLYGFASQYDNEDDYNSAVTEINRRQKYQGKSYDELIDASKNTEDEDESKWLKNYAEETVSYDDIKAKYDGVKQREAEVNAKLNEYMDAERSTSSIEEKQKYAALLDPLYKESEEIEKQLRDIEPVYDSKTAEKNNDEYAKKYEGLNYTELKAKISDADSEGEKKWLESKADEAATSADYEKEIAELEAKQKERYAENGWGGSDQYGGEIRILKDKLALKQREEKAAEYEKSVRENGDFDEQSKRYDGGAIQNVVDVVTPDIDNSDSVYKFINTVSTNDELTHNPLAFVTDDERKTFNYLYNSGKKDEATEYIKSIQRSLNERYTQSNNEKAAEYAKEHPYLASAVSLGTNLISGTGVIEDVGNRLIGEPIDTNSPMHYGANQTRALRGTVKDTYFNDVGTFGYDTVMSAVDSAVLIGLSSITGGAAGAAFGGSEAAAAAIAGKVTSTASSIIMGSQVATNTVIDAKERGLTDDQAVILGVLYGAVEALSEKYSIEHWLGNPKSIGSYLGKAFVAEGSEEVAANWGDRLADLLVTGDKNQVNQMYQDYIKQGYSDKEAFTLTAYNLIGEDTQAFIAGGVSGAAMSGTHMAVSGVSNKIGEVRTKNAVANLTASELTKSENKETLNSTIDFVKNNAESGSKEFKFSEKLGQAVENGETISVKDAKKLLKYSDNLDQKKYDTATKGFTDEEKAIVNNAVYKLTHRQSLSDQENAQIKGNDKIIKAVSDYSGIEQDEVVELLDSSKFKDNLKYYKSKGNGLLEIDGKEFRGTVEIENTNPATGKATLKLTSPDGKDVRLISSDNANFKNNTEARLYATAANFKNPNEANAFVENYNGGDFNEYLNEWNLYSNYGSLGFNAKQIYQRINQNVDTPSRKAAYYSGMENFKAFAQIQNINKRAYEAAAKSFKGYQRGTFVNNVSSERLWKMSRAQRKSIRELKMFTFAGLNVELFESKTDEHGNYQGENGSFDAKTKTLRVDINAGYSNNEQAIKEAAKAYIRLTVAHELTHAAEQGGGYMKLRSEIIRTLEAAGFDYKGLVDKKLNELNSKDKYKDLGQDKLYRLADSEVIADCCETLLNDSKVFEKLFNADKTLAEKFINAVKRAIEKLRQFFKENPTYARTEYGKALQEAMSKVENRVQELWDEAVAQGIRAENKESGSVKNEIRKTIDLTPTSFTIKKNAPTAQTNDSSSDRNGTFSTDIILDNSEKINTPDKKSSDRISDYDKAIEFSDNSTKYSIRTEDPPENTVKGYKVFRVKNGKLYPPMVANPGGEATPVGVWLNADVGERAPDSKTGRAQVKGKGGMSLSFRPGWHLGDIPRASQFDRKNPETGVKELFPSDFVWAECDCAADVDYQDEAMSYGYTEKGKFRHSYAGLPRVPENGYYKYRTNPRPDTVPWIITGAIKVNRILSDSEVEQILKENGVEAPQRQGGNKTLEELGLNNEHIKSSDRFDTDYLSAVERGDMKTAQQMVDEAAKAAGYGVKAYHQTAANFTVFSTDDPKAGLNDSETPNGIFFKTNDHDIGLDGKKQLPVYLNVGKVLDFNNRSVANMWYRRHIEGYETLDKEMKTKVNEIESEMNSIEVKMFSDSITDVDYDKLDEQWNQLLEQMREVEDNYRSHLRELLNNYFLKGESGYNSIHLGYDGHRYVNGKREDVETYILFDRNNVKSADPVTYDDDGNVIPLSERFNEEQEDIRYQGRYNEFDDLFDMGEDLFEDDSKREIFDEMIEKYPYEALYIIQNAAEQTVENILTKTKSVKLDDSTYLYIARKFMQAYNISRAANPEEDNYLAAKIKNIVARIEAGELSQSEIMNEFINTASDALVLSGTLDDTMKNEREFVISLIKGKTLLVTDQQEDHIRENYGDLRRYRTTLGHGYVALEKNAKKKSITGAQGVYIEDIIEEVQEAYPQLIDEDANQITGFGWLEKLLNERLEPTFKSDSYSTPEIDAVNGGYEIMTNLVDQKARQIVRDNKNGQKYAQLGNTAREFAQEQRKAVKEAVSKVKEKERQKAKKDIKEAREKAEARYKAKLEKKEQQFKEKLDEQREKTRELRREKNDIIIAEKQKRVNDLRRLRDNRERRDVIEKINKTAAKMRQMILRPTDTAYVPDEFKNGFIEVTDGITQALKLSDDTKIGQHLNKLSDLLRKLATDDRTESVFGYEFDENFRDRVQEFAAVINGKKIDKSLTLREANDIHNLLKSVVTIVRNANKLINSQERRSISEAGIQIMLEQENLDSKWLNKQLKTIKKYFMTPLRMSEIINAYNDKAVLTKLVNELNRGLRKKDKFFMVANLMFDDYREENIKELDHSSKDVREIRWTDNAGNSRVTRMTGMQAMQICMTWNREIADDNLVHISEGGLTIFDPDQLAKGNNKKALEKATKIHGVNNSFITSVASSLTRFEKGYIDIAEQYFNEYSKDAINETSLALKHFKIANSKYYIPIKVDKNSIAKEIEGIKFDSSVENQGMFNSVVPKSRKSIYIQGLDSLINNHIQGVSNYYGLAIPIRNLNKTLNVRNVEYDADGVVVNENTVKDALNKNWGEMAINNYEQMLIDLQKPQALNNQDNSKELNNAIRFIRSNFVTSVLNFNPSVTLKQAASYFTAGAYIDGSILGKGFVHFWVQYGRPGRYKALLDEIDSHTAQHYIRRQGLSSNEIADINDNWLSKAAQNTKIGRKITTSKIAQGIPSGFNPNKWIQNMDCLTTAMLWVATKDQVNRDFNKAKKEIGTDEYWQAVTDLYDKVIEDTQPMYDPLHRPVILKTSNEFVKSVFMFKTQPLQNAGIIYDALGRAVQGNKGAIRKLGKAVASQTASLVTFALMTLAVSMLRHNPRRYRDENDELTAESIFDQVLEDIFTNGMGILFPFGGTEIMTMFTQDGDAVQDNVAVQLNKFGSAFTDFWEVIDNYNDAMSMGLDTDPQDILSAFKSFAVIVSQDITGLPVNNAIKNIEGVTGWINDVFFDKDNQLLAPTSEPKNKQVAGRYERQIENGNTAEAEKILNEYYQKELEKAKADKDIKDPESKAQANTRDMLANTYKTEYQEAFLKNDEKTMQKIVKILYSANKYMKWGKGKSQTPLDKKLEEWRKNAKDDIQKKH